MAKQPTQTPEAREGFAISLVKHMFPDRAHDPKLIQFFYDWELRAQSSGGTFLDPLNAQKGRDYRTRHDALTATQHMLRSPKYQALTKDLERGDTASARVWLSKHGNTLHHTDMPSPVDKNTGQLQGSGGNWATWLDGSGALDGAKGIGDWFTQNKTLALVLIVVVLFAVLKK